MTPEEIAKDEEQHLELLQRTRSKSTLRPRIHPEDVKGGNEYLSDVSARGRDAADVQAKRAEDLDTETLPKSLVDRRTLGQRLDEGSGDEGAVDSYDDRPGRFSNQ